MTDGFFKDFGDGIFKGKGISALKNSKAGRSALIGLFGGTENLPSSIMKAKRESGILVDEHGYDNTAPGIEKSRDGKIPKIVRRAYYLSGRGTQNGALSHFPQNIGTSIVLLYSEPGDTVFDPFAGHNSRMELCVRAGRHYRGCDISTEFMKSNRARAEKLREEFPSAKIKLYHCDSRKVPLNDCVGDFTITSPPYYDIEQYGDEPEQLGKCETYHDFLIGIKKVLRENFRVLKPNAYAVWFINDFRRKGKMHFYHVDIIRLGSAVGFIPHDIMIVDFGPSIRDCFTNQMMEQRILPKRHEYAVIFRKPE